MSIVFDWLYDTSVDTYEKIRRDGYRIEHPVVIDDDPVIDGFVLIGSLARWWQKDAMYIESPSELPGR
jgi:hypothetical protein